MTTDTTTQTTSINDQFDYCTRLQFAKAKTLNYVRTSTTRAGTYIVDTITGETVGVQFTPNSYMVLGSILRNEV